MTVSCPWDYSSDPPLVPASFPPLLQWSLSLGVTDKMLCVAVSSQQLLMFNPFFFFDQL